jgi:serine/threonine-protein kinase
MSGKPSWIGYSLKGRYRIEEQVGQGGMSAVYRASDPNLRREVAVKLIHPHLSRNPDFIRRFEEEAAAVARLSHPNILQVYDFDHDADTYYMVMEFLTGETLHEYLHRLNQADMRMDPADIVQVAASVCDAIDYAHRLGMVHRDIKPANVMLRADGRITLMDFGIAKIVGGDTLTGTGAVVGTVNYMGPEIVRGEPASPQTDIYSLGVMLFEMIGGRLPFEADSAMSTMMMHLNAPVPDLLSLSPDAPPDLVEIANVALRKEAADRFWSAAEMAAALRGISLAAAPAQAFPPVDTAPMDMLRAQPPTAPAMPDPHQYIPTVVDEPLAAAAAPTATPAAAAPRGRLSPAVVAGITAAAVFAVGLIALYALVPGLFGGGVSQAEEPGATSTVETPTTAPTATQEPTRRPTSSPTRTPAPTAQATSTGAAAAVRPTSAYGYQSGSTPVPTAIPSAIPTAVPTGGGALYVQIQTITLDGSAYVVNYTTTGYTETLPGRHVHFFFNTVPPDQAGLPGGGPWILYGGPRPFTQYTVNDRPAGATQMCALVANEDHSVIAGSGNCIALP